MKVVISTSSASSENPATMSSRSLKSPHVQKMQMSSNVPSVKKELLLTEDKDFGQLVFAHGKEVRGVVFLRYPTSVKQKLFHDVIRLVKQHGRKLAGCFVVVEPGRTRISRTPRT